MKHKSIIKAWLDGETVQYKTPIGSEWHTCEHPDNAPMVCYGFHDAYEYRIKPKEKVTCTTGYVNREGKSVFFTAEVTWLDNKIIKIDVQ